MVPDIGTDVLVNGQKVHVQDRSNLSMTAKVGIPDANGLVWDTWWVEWRDIQPLPNELK